MLPALLFSVILGSALTPQDDLKVPLVQGEDDLLKVPLVQVRVPHKFGSGNRRFEHPLENHADMVWLARVRLGDSNKVFRAMFDCGSSDIWFISSNCRSKFCRGRPAYKWPPADDYTQEYSLTYDAGNAFGPLARASIRLSGREIEELDFVAAEDVNIPDYFEFEGIIGMSPRLTGYQTNRPTFMKKLVDEKIIRRMIFSFILEDFDSRDSEGSYMIFGGIDKRLLLDELYWINSNHHLFWKIPITHVGFGSTFGKAKGQAIIDSGTSFILCPENILAGINNLIGARQEDATFYSVNCKAVSDLPSITLITEGDFHMVLEPDVYIQKEQGICYTVFLPSPSKQPGQPPDWILGASFLRRFYVAFDMDKQSIGIARYRHA